MCGDDGGAAAHSRVMSLRHMISCLFTPHHLGKYIYNVDLIGLELELELDGGRGWDGNGIGWVARHGGGARACMAGKCGVT